MHKQFPILLITILAVSSLFAQQPDDEITETTRVGVLGFEANGVSDSDAAALTDLFRSELVSSGYFEVVDRNNLDAVLAEQELQLTGLTDPDSAVEIGKLVNAEYMLFGSYFILGISRFITIELVNVETGEIARSSRRRVDAGDDLNAKVVALVAEIAGATQERQAATFVRQGFGILTITTIPPNALVYIDDEFAGQTPFRQEMEQGVYDIRISKSGHLPIEFQDAIESGVTKELDVSLESGISVEEAFQRRNAARTGIIRNSIFTGVSGLAIVGGIVLGNYYNALGDETFAEYNGALFTSLSTRLGDEYSSQYDTADMFYLFAETGILLGGVFLIWTVFDVVRFMNYDRMFREQSAEQTVRLTPMLDEKNRLGVAFALTY